MTIKVRLKKRLSRSDELKKRTNSHVFNACMETAFAIENDVKGQGPNAAPVDTGNLRSSYHVRGVPAKVMAIIGSDLRIAEYAPAVEFGSSKSRAQPHLRPAGRAQKDKHRKRVEKAMKRAAKDMK